MRTAEHRLDARGAHLFVMHALIQGEERMNPEDMKKRTMEYALRVVRLVGSLPKDPVSRHIGGQLLRAGTSVPANYRAACRARSKAEFVSRMGIVEEEADEALFWMEFLIAAGIMPSGRMGDLMNEGNEIVSIVVRSRQTARARAASKAR